MSKNHQTPKTVVEQLSGRSGNRAINCPVASSSPGRGPEILNAKWATQCLTGGRDGLRRRLTLQVRLIVEIRIVLVC